MHLSMKKQSAYHFETKSKELDEKKKEKCLKANRYASQKRENSSKIVDIEPLQHRHMCRKWQCIIFYSSYQIHYSGNYALDLLA